MACEAEKTGLKKNDSNSKQLQFVKDSLNIDDLVDKHFIIHVMVQLNCIF